MHKTRELQYFQSESSDGICSKEHVKSLSSRNSNVKPLIWGSDCRKFLLVIVILQMSGLGSKMTLGMAHFVVFLVEI